MSQDTPPPGSDYAPPLDQLLTMGDPGSGTDWTGYGDMGFTAEHVPELIRMATDDALHYAEWTEEGTVPPLVWAPVHAWRVLAQLGATEAAAPLLGLGKRLGDDFDDWILDDIPEVLARLGPDILPVVAEHLDPDKDFEVYERKLGLFAMEHLYARHPDAKPLIQDVLEKSLEQHERHDPEVNLWTCSALAELGAVETLPTMEEAFEAGNVEVDYLLPDLLDFKVTMGLVTPEEADAQRSPLPPAFGSTSGMSSSGSSKAAPDKKKKRKQAKKSKKINRNKKKKRK